MGKHIIVVRCQKCKIMLYDPETHKPPEGIARIEWPNVWVHCPMCQVRGICLVIENLSRL